MLITGNNAQFLKKCEILRDVASGSVVNVSAGNGSCDDWSVFEPRSNHRFFKPNLRRKKK